MAKDYETNPRVAQIFTDLEAYREFCVDYGYRYDESTLYDMRDYVYRQHTKQLGGKVFKDGWAESVRPTTYSKF